jgi:hypothetical protein
VRKIVVMMSRMDLRLADTRAFGNGVVGDDRTAVKNLRSHP